MSLMCLELIEQLQLMDLKLENHSWIKHGCNITSTCQLTSNVQETISKNIIWERLLRSIIQIFFHKKFCGDKKKHLVMESVAWKRNPGLMSLKIMLNQSSLMSNLRKKEGFMIQCQCSKMLYIWEESITRCMETFILLLSPSTGFHPGVVRIQTPVLESLVIYLTLKLKMRNSEF